MFRDGHNEFRALMLVIKLRKLLYYYTAIILLYCKLSVRIVDCVSTLTLESIIASSKTAVAPTIAVDLAT